MADTASLERGARDFAGYCRGCHSLKYMRYSRLASDLQITPEQLQKYLLPANAKASDYITSPMPAADAQTWFGKVPPDLSLIARERGDDYLYRFLTTFFSDPSRTTGANNLQLASVAMPDVLSTLEGVKVAVSAPRIISRCSTISCRSHRAANPGRSTSARSGTS